MERDDGVSGEGNSYTTMFRQYDPRVGRWLTSDPLFANFPWQSPYVGFDNNPIYYNDPKGAAAEGGGEGDDDKIKDQGSTEEVDVKATRTFWQKVKGIVKKIGRSIKNLRTKRKVNEEDRKDMDIDYHLMPVPSDNTRIENYPVFYYERVNSIERDSRLKGDIRSDEYFDLPPSKNLNKEVMELAKLIPKQVFYSTQQEPVQDFDPDTRIGYRLRRTPGSSVITHTEKGWKKDTVFYDKLTNKSYSWTVYIYDSILGTGREPHVNPRKWIKEYPYIKK